MSIVHFALSLCQGHVISCNGACVLPPVGTRSQAKTIPLFSEGLMERKRIENLMLMRLHGREACGCCPLALQVPTQKLTGCRAGRSQGHRRNKGRRVHNQEEQDKGKHHWSFPRTTAAVPAPCSCFALG
eukprot:3200528-Rhodomonas_salina.1